MLLEFPNPENKFPFFSIFFCKTQIMTRKSPTLTYILTKEPTWNNIFQQSFGSDTQAEKCFKIATDRAISDVHDV